ncbi:MAG: CapA family protein [Candidatus Cloacimonetes bacterium]|nr:CapA family protein [Candidatus Cloacimonadota bacterium]
MQYRDDLEKLNNLSEGVKSGIPAIGVEDPQALSLTFLGDICLNDDYNSYWQKGIKPFAFLEEHLRQADLVVGNLECFARGDMGINPLRPYALTAEPETLGYLKDLHLGLAGLANNHIYDNLDDGFAKTIIFLEANRIAHMGASLEGKEQEPFIFCEKGIKIGILNYITQDTNPQRPQGAKAELNWFSLDKAQEDISKLRGDVDHVVIFPHWGGEMEGSMYPEPALRDLAHKLIDLGADLIVGHHSHTLQPFEIYKGKHIFYSLGNFCWSDLYKDGIRCESDYARTRRSLMLVVDFSREGYTVHPVGIINDGKQIRPQSKAELRLPNFSGKRPWLYQPLVWSLYYFYEKNIYKIQRHFFGNGRNPLKQLFKIKPEKLKKAARTFVETFKSSKT